MAILDERTEFADATSVAAAAGTALIGDVIDLEVTGLAEGLGQPVYLVIQVDTSIITGGAAGTVQFILASDAAAAIATDGTASQHLLTKAFVTDDDALNELDAGAQLVFALPELSVEAYERYLGILCVTATTTTTAGAISAYLTLTPPTMRKVFADATN